MVETQTTPMSGDQTLRVVSLLPAATEIVAALGMLDRLVGVSHDCDYPPEVNKRPRVTQCPIHDAGLTSDAIDQWVRETLATAGSLYSMDEALMRRLQPEVILTQRLCDVCAVGYESVAAFAATLPGPPRVVNLEPSTLDDILQDIRRVGGALGAAQQAEEVVARLHSRIEQVRQLAAPARRRRVVVLEWIDPPFSSGHWTPELVEIAGGVEPVGRKAQDAIRIPWEAVRDARPEVLLVACCGYSMERALADFPLLRRLAGWSDLPAVRGGEVYVTDGSAYFSRPGPRVVDSLEILAEILHPELFRDRFPKRQFQRVLDA